MNPSREQLLFGLVLMKPAAERAAWLDANAREIPPCGSASKPGWLAQEETKELLHSVPMTPALASKTAAPKSRPRYSHRSHRRRISSVQRQPKPGSSDADNHHNGSRPNFNNIGWFDGQHGASRSAPGFLCSNSVRVSRIERATKNAKRWFVLPASREYVYPFPAATQFSILRYFADWAVPAARNTSDEPEFCPKSRKG